MADHYWDDDWFQKNGDDLYTAIRFFSKYMSRFGLMYCPCKEKYGTMRLEWFDCLFGRFELGSIFGNNYLFIRNKFLHRIDTNYITPIAVKIGLQRLFCMYQRLVFNIITVITVKKWPNCREEIVDDHYFNDLLYNWVKINIKYTNNWV